MAEQVARIKLLAQIEGLEGFDKLKSAFKGLQQAIGPADADLSKARKEILEFGKAGAKTEQVLRGQIEALKALQSQATIGSTVYRQLSKDVKELGGSYKEAATGVKQFTDAQLKSQKAGAKTSTFTPQIQALKRDLAELSVYSQAYADKLTEIKRRELPFNLAQGRQGVIAGFEAYRLGPELANQATKMPVLPDTTAGLNQRLSELNAEFVNLARGGTDWIRVSREIAAVQRQLNQEFANPAVEAARRRLEASRNTSSGFLAFSEGLDDRIAIEKSIARNQRKREAEAAARSGAMQGPPPPSELFRNIAGISNTTASNQLQLMGRSYGEVAASIRQTTAASDGSINSLRAQRNSWEELRNTLGNNKAALREVNKEIAAVDRQLEKRGVGGGGIGPKVQAFGAIASGAIFGGVEGAVGGLAGAAIGGVPGAFAGAAVGGSISMIRQNVVAMGEFSAEVAKMEIALRGVAGSADEFAAAQQVIRLAQIDLNVPVMEATQGFTQLTAAVKGAGGNVGDAEVVFRGVTEAIKATGGGAEQVQGALTAMAQIFSKGKVSAEELQGQLGERLPGAVTLFAEATGRTLPQLQKDLEQGVVGLNDVMKFAASLSDKYSEQAVKMAASTEDSTARMKVALDDLKRAFGSIVQPITASVQSVITQLAEMAVRALRAVGLVKDSMAELGAAGRAKDLQARAVDAYRALGSGPQSYPEKKRAFELAEGLANAATPQKSLAGIKQNIQALQQAQQVVRQINAKGLDNKQIKLLENYGAKLDKRIAGEQELLKALQDQRKLTEFQAPESKGKSDRDKTFERLAEVSQRREESLFNARQQYEERIAEIRRSAIEQAQQLERQFGDERRNIERDIERIRRQIAATQADTAFTSRIQSGEDATLVESERGIDQIIRKAEEERIRIREEYSDKELQRTRTIADFQKNIADQINKANEAYAKQIGKIQREYAINSAKVVEKGGDAAGKQLEQSARLSALYMQRGALNATVAGNTGSFVADPGRPNAGGFSVEQFANAGWGERLGKELAAIIAIDEQIQEISRQVQQFRPPAAPAIAAPTLPPGVQRIPVSQQFDMPGAGAVAAANAQRQQVQLEQVNATALDELTKRFQAISSESTQQVRTLKEQSSLINLQITYLRSGYAPELANQLSQQQAIFDKQKEQAEAERVSALARGVSAAEVNTLYQNQLAVIERQNQETVALTKQIAEQKRLLETDPKVVISKRLSELRSELDQLSGMGNLIVNMSQTIESSLSSAISTAVGSFVTGATTIRQTLAEMFRSIGEAFIKMAADIIAKQLMMVALNQIVGLFGGGFGGFSGAGPVSGAAASGINFNPAAFTPGLSFMATGGVMTPTGPLPLKRYAGGGVANSPQMAVYGERGPEAYVPLPDGRNIPVKMKQRTEALNRYRPMGAMGTVAPDGEAGGAGSAGGGAVGGAIDVRYSVERINNVEYVTAEQFQKGMRQAATQGATLGEKAALRRLQYSPGGRKGVGI